MRIKIFVIAAILCGLSAPAPAQNAARQGEGPLTIQAIQSLRPGAQWTLGRADDLASLLWLDAVQTRPSDAEINSEIARISSLPIGVLDFANFVGRWTQTEYSNLMKARAAAIANNTAGMALVKQWDQAMVRGAVDMSAQAAKDFKAALVTAGILTQARADVVFQ